MNQAIKLAKEILRKQEALEKTKSTMLRVDYQKNIHYMQRELRYYCKARGISYSEVWEKAK